MAKGCLKFGLIGKISPNLVTLVTKQTLELIEKKKKYLQGAFWRSYHGFEHQIRKHERGIEQRKRSQFRKRKKK